MITVIICTSCSNQFRLIYICSNQFRLNLYIYVLKYGSVYQFCLLTGHIYISTKSVLIPYYATEIMEKSTQHDDCNCIIHVILIHVLCIFQYNTILADLCMR